MTAKPATHPSKEVLQAYGLGKLEGAAEEAVRRHLDGCPDCVRQAAGLSGDSFLHELRAAHGRTGTPADAYATRASAGPSPTVADLPAGLANNPLYEVLRELGRGGMGVVYLARQTKLNRHEVLKVVNPELSTRGDSRARFVREMQSAARLNHPNLVTAYGTPEAGELLVFAMEYVEGEDLARVVQARGPLPVAHACYYAAQAAQGLQHAFEHGMVHRDIKPHNLILARQGKRHVVKVTDFGLAKARGEGRAQTELTGQNMAMGTPDYMAPEQILDAATADVRADIYSLGCTLYFLLTGAAPFKGKSTFDVFQAHISTEAQPLDRVRPDVPAGLALVVMKMMAKDPAQRYQKPTEAAQVLMPFAKAGPPGAPATSRPAKGAGAEPRGRSRAGGTTAGKKARQATMAPAIPATVSEGAAAVAGATKEAGGGWRPPGTAWPWKWPAIVGAVLCCAALLGAGAYFLLHSRGGTRAAAGATEIPAPAGDGKSPESVGKDGAPLDVQVAKLLDSDQWDEVLRKTVKFSGFDDPETRFEDVFRSLEKLARDGTGRGLEIAVNQQAFSDDFSIDNVLARPIGKEIPGKAEMTLHDVLELVVSRIPAKGCARYQLTKDGIEVTSVMALHVSTRGSARDMPLREVLDYFEDRFRIQIDSTPVRDCEKKLVKVPAASDVPLRMLLKRTLRDAEAMIARAEEGGGLVFSDNGGISLAPRK